MANAKKPTKIQQAFAEAKAKGSLAPLTTTEQNVLATEEAKIKASKLDLQKQIGKHLGRINDLEALVEKLETVHARQIEQMEAEFDDLWEKYSGYQMKVKDRLETVTTLRRLIDEKLNDLGPKFERLSEDGSTWLGPEGES